MSAKTVTEPARLIQSRFYTMHEVGWANLPRLLK